MENPQEQPTPAPEPAEVLPETYAIIEVFGHRRLIGRVFEVDRYGAKMLRIDIPKDGDFALGYTTQYYGGGSLFSETPCDLEMVKRHYARLRPPVAQLAHRNPFDEDEHDDTNEYDQ
jgi:hypothetical protein